MTNLDTLKESEVPGLDDDTLCAAVAKWCEGLEVVHKGNWFTLWNGEWIIKTGDAFVPFNPIPAYLTDGNAAFRLIVKYQLNTRWFASDLGEIWNGCEKSVEFYLADTESRAGDVVIKPKTLFRAVTEAALVVELRRRYE